jgi:hypothetical protein
MHRLGVQPQIVEGRHLARSLYASIPRGSRLVVEERARWIISLYELFFQSMATTQAAVLAHGVAEGRHFLEGNKRNVGALVMSVVCRSAQSAAKSTSFRRRSRAS